MNETVTDAMVEAALAAWYPGEWPDDPVFQKPGSGQETFAATARREMRATLEAAFRFVQPSAQPSNMIEALTNRFLSWPLPGSVNSDHCVIDRTYKFPRSGTNLLSADEARQMAEYLIAIIPGFANPYPSAPEFVKQEYGAVVATILETGDSIVEVQERNDGEYGLIVYHRHDDRDIWDDLTAYLKPEHFEMLGLVALRMRGEAALAAREATP